MGFLKHGGCWSEWMLACCSLDDLPVRSRACSLLCALFVGIIRDMERLGLRGEEYLNRQADEECLQVLRIWRPKAGCQRHISRDL